MQETGRHAADETVAATGHQRYANPQGIAGSGVGVDRQGVEKEVRQSDSGQIVFRPHRPGENQATRIDAASQRFTAKIGLGRFAIRQLPQHAARCARQQTAPHIKHLGPDLVGLIKAAKDEAGLGQPDIGAAWHGRDRTKPIIGLIGIGQPGESLGELIGLFRRQDDRIDDGVIDEGCTHRGRKAEIGHLDRGGPHRHDAGARIQCEALQIDQHIDAIGTNPLGGFAVAQSGHVDEGITRGLDATAQSRSVIATIGIEPCLEPIAIVQFEHAGDQHRGGVIVIVVREIADSQTLACRAIRRQYRRHRFDLAEIAAGKLGEDAPLNRGIHTGGQKHERHIGLRIGLCDDLVECSQIGFEQGPVAGLQAVINRPHQAGPPTRMQRQSGANALQPLDIHGQPRKRIAHDRIGLEIIGLAGDRLQQRRDRFEMAVGLLQRLPVLEPGGVVGTGKLSHASGVINRILIAMTLHADRHSQLSRQRIAGGNSQGRLDRRTGAIKVSQLASRLTEIDPIERLGGSDLRGARIRLLGILPATCQSMGNTTTPVALGLLVHNGLGR